ncbi:AraC family transcriptional regulator [Aquimarina sp. RZ0]|uniref:AraC family transcriptional regulator n=1 Tax=Aquimarina sp. RZ0 TaxID=2607730 RepID=UPI0011F1E079|nr:AraC family transcriptional regulator [Aquimarina sp. RZ0]KAA1243500.1 helix-turn-helix transcriptional regulator [Aquimarina sp. RZ0]
MQKVLQSLQLALLNIGYAHLNTDWNYDNVISPFTRLYYITKGSARVYHSKKEFELQPGYMYLIPSFIYSRYTCDHYHEQYYISFFEEIKNGISVFNLTPFVYQIKAAPMDMHYFERLLEINPERALIDDDPKVYDNRPTLLNFQKKNEQLSSAEYLETNGILRILLSRFMNEQSDINIKARAINDISQTISYISENLHREITVSELASFCHLSTDHFSRVFKRQFGMPPNFYMQSKRVERAQLLLLTTNHSLQQIAEKVGLENLSYFSRVFKKHAGKTPGNFRKQQMRV